MQSRKLNINPYLDTLKDVEKSQTNELLKIQTKEYIEFVKNFVEASSIVTKTFYIVIPFSPPPFASAKGALGSIFGKLQGKANASERMDDNKFEEYRSQLWQRVDAVAQGLVRSGVRVAPLNTEELIELYYGLFNPGELEKGKAPGLIQQ